MGRRSTGAAGLVLARSTLAELLGMHTMRLGALCCGACYLSARDCSAEFAPDEDRQTTDWLKKS